MKNFFFLLVTAVGLIAPMKAFAGCGACINGRMHCWQSNCGISGVCHFQSYFVPCTTPQPLPAPIALQSVVEVKVDSKLYSGTTVVGNLPKGTHARLVNIQGQWASLTDLEGQPITGWIPLANITQVKE